MSALLHPDLLAAAPALREDFDQAQPFRHLVMEPFFEAAIAEQLSAQFPAFDKGNARDENGKLGGKSTFEQMSKLGSAYASVDQCIQSPQFLQWLSAITGIPELLYDPDYFGGGTHENRPGQELDPHVDFNRHPGRGWHRRLNLIIYLNRSWQSEWGGQLQLHRDPRSEHDQVHSIEPRYNRAVLFETHDHSWHGFPPIVADADADVSRKSIALYFYTEARGHSDRGLDHSTIYVERPLSSRFAPGRTLDEADVAELQRLLAKETPHLPVIMLTAHGDLPMAVDSMRAGAWHFVEKPYDRKRLLGIITEALAADHEFRLQNAERLEIEQNLASLTDREREVLQLLVDGKSTKMAALALGTSPNTIAHQRASILEKMQAESVVDLSRMVHLAQPEADS